MAIAGEKTGVEKVAEKLAEKRRALGRGLESLLPGGPRVVPSNDPTFAQNTRKDGAPSEASAMPTGGLDDKSAGASADSSAVGERVDLQAVAAPRRPAELGLAAGSSEGRPRPTGT